MGAAQSGAGPGAVRDAGGVAFVAACLADDAAARQRFQADLGPLVYRFVTYLRLKCRASARLTARQGTAVLTRRTPQRAEARPHGFAPPAFSLQQDLRRKYTSVGQFEGSRSGGARPHGRERGGLVGGAIQPGETDRSRPPRKRTLS